MGVRFVAEVSSNHAQDMNRAKEFIDVAAQIGCDAVKFQLFRIEDLFSEEILSRSEAHRQRKAWELPPDFLPELAAHTSRNKMLFGCTPFSLEAVSQLEPYVDYYKIGSYELLWKALFDSCYATGKPLSFSTGMATIEEIDQALDWVTGDANIPITLLHCNSAYPTPVKDVNLQSMSYLEDRYKDKYDPGQVSIGYSDHSRNPAVIYRAVHNFRATEIEFHMDLDTSGAEYQAGHCWLPEEMAQVIDTVRTGMDAGGTYDVIVSESEKSDREWRADPSDGLRPLNHVRKGFR